MSFVSVVIPVYKAAPDREELSSFKRCLVVLGNYTITLIAPVSLNIDYYELYAMKNGVKISIERFDDIFFKSIAGYNHLMINEGFYKRFEVYKFILIYQLDAYVFKDELMQWCEMGYDFIGAPLFVKWVDPDNTFQFIAGANGGLSLRKVKSSLRMLKRVRKMEILRKKYSLFSINYMIPYMGILKLLRKLFRVKDVLIASSSIDYMANEDYLWSYIFACGFSDYKVAPSEIAFKFSFEVNPSFLFEKNNRQLPFGCHAWKKYEPLFWEQFIIQ